MTAVAVLAIVATLAILSPASDVQNEFGGEGRLRGKLLLGDRPLERGWVEMIQLDGPPEDRCGPGDCGADVSALGSYWPSGRWRVKPPAVKGWVKPDPIVIQVTADEVTRFTLIYERKRADKGD